MTDLLPALDAQELAFVECLFARLPVSVASRRVGIPHRTGLNWSKRPEILTHLQHLSDAASDHLLTKVKYTAEDAHMDIEMGKRMSANAMEWFRGVELHMKLHDIAQPKTSTQVNVQVNNLSKIDQLEVMGDEQLLALAGDDFRRLQPEIPSDE